MSRTVGVGLICTLFLFGCSSGSHVVQQPAPAKETVSDAARDAALQHYINGSLFETKGEFANAVLEYQDAIRLDPNHAIYFALAKCYSALNKHSLAIEAGRKAVALAPDNLDYRRMLAGVYVSAYEIDSAAAQYAEIVQRDSSNISSWFNLARLYEGKKPLRALEVYESITDRFGPQWDVLLQIAQLNNAMQRYDKAARALRQMLDLDPENTDLMRNVSRAYIQAEEYDSALAVLGALREIDPGNIETIADIGTVHLLKKDYATAAKEFDAVFAQDTVSLDTKLRIGQAYFGQLEKDSTLTPITQALFGKIRDNHPDDWRAYWFLGAIGAITHNDTLSIANFRKVTELAGWNADGWVYLSSVFMENNKYDEVVTILESAIRVVPDDFRVNFYLGIAYYRLNRYDAAVRQLEKARTIDPKDLGAISQLALVYDALKKPEESDRLYEEALKIDPDNHLVLNNYSYSLSERGLQLQRALEMSGKALEAQPDNPSYLDTYGWIQYQLGNYREAEKYISEAITKGDVSAVVHEHLGDVYFRLDDRERAIEQWNIALRMDSDNNELREKVARGTL